MRLSRGSLLGGFLDSWVNNLGLIQEKIKEIECGLLVSNFRDPKTVGLVKENIGRSSDGSSSHRAGALKLGLRKAFELKKQKKQSPGVLLRCGNHQCVRHNDPTPYLFVGSDLYCSQCGSHYMRCVGWGYARTGAHASCHGCGKNFISMDVFAVGLPTSDHSNPSVVQLYSFQTQS